MESEIVTKLLKSPSNFVQGPGESLVHASVGRKKPIGGRGMSEKNDRDEVLREEEVVEVLREGLGGGIGLVSYSLGPASDNLAGFLGEHYRLEAEVEAGGERKKFKYFVKRIPSAVPQHREYALQTRAFYKEVELYKTLFADLKNAQKDAENPTKWRPEYYYSRGSEVFVLEDLAAQGYYMYPERTLLDEEHVKASLSAMAGMHAASLVFEEKFRSGKAGTLAPGFRPSSAARDAGLCDLYAHLTFETEATDEKGHPGNAYHEAGMGSPVKIVDFLPGYSDREKEIVREKFPDVFRRYFQLVKTSDRFKNVFLHGDLWANNLLFRKDETGKVRDALIIDFQLARYAPPAHDVMMFLHLVQSRRFREEHGRRLLDYYHAAFARELDKNGLKAEALLPRETFLESCVFYDDLGLISKLFYFQFILAPPEITNKFLSSPDFFTKIMLVDRTEMVVECFLEDEICRTRMTEALNDVIKRFILQ